MHKSLYGFDGPLAAPQPALSPARQLAARALRQSSRWLARLARQIAMRRSLARARRAPELEFYAEAGAPEGALYLDGELVGYIPGINRL
ncbi:hypothetical protein [Pseudaquabacterium pictum]|uniref:Uncharacterized protein n=1 Tax=Pseudaquabacterium pictum TaxID=2315236 RepID=A0A480AZM5_9BURK|nr:hypothetical protein [Rubrivivax pictus]GCL65752.1 hypothetical protein AQPW35_48330 [Rubrivivax pictus]